MKQASTPSPDHPADEAAIEDVRAMAKGARSGWRVGGEPSGAEAERVDRAHSAFVGANEAAEVLGDDLLNGAEDAPSVLVWAVARAYLAAVDRPAGAAVRAAAAEHVIRAYSKDSGVKVAGAQAALESEIFRMASVVYDRVASFDESAPLPLDAGKPLWLDEAIVAVLRSTNGPEGAKLADQIEAASIERVRVALSGVGASPKELAHVWAHGAGQKVPRFLLCIAKAAWRDIVGPEMREQRRQPPALVYPAHEAVSAIFRPRLSIECVGGQLPLDLRSGATIRLRDDLFRDDVALADEALLSAARRDLARKGLVLFGTVVGHRAIRHQIRTGHEQRIGKKPDYRVISIDGGYSAYAHEVLGLKSKAQAEQLRQVIEAEHACEIQLPPVNSGSYGTLLSREFRAPGPGRRSNLRLILGTMLVPYFVTDYKKDIGDYAKSQAGSDLLRLVPVLDLPPFVGRQNEHGAQATLSMDVVAHMRAHARDMATRGGAPLDPPTFQMMAKRAGLPVEMAAPVLDRWKQDGTDAPAFLKVAGPDRYTLGDAHEAARAFIESAGRQSAAQSKRGKMAKEGRLK